MHDPLQPTAGGEVDSALGMDTGIVGGARISELRHARSVLLANRIMCRVPFGPRVRSRISSILKRTFRSRCRKALYGCRVPPETLDPPCDVVFHGATVPVGNKSQGRGMHCPRVVKQGDAG